MKFSTKISADFYVVIAAALIILSCSLLLYAEFSRKVEAGDAKRIGTVSFKREVAQRKYASQVIWEDLDSDAPVYDNDSIRTAEQSEAVIQLADGTKINLDENSLILLAMSGESVNIDFTHGSITANRGGAKEGEAAKINIQSKGTLVSLKEGDVKLSRTDEKAMDVTVTSGKADVKTGKEEKTINKDEKVVISKDAGARVVKIKLKLMGPAPGTNLVSAAAAVPVTFTWEPVAGNAGIFLEIGRDSGFTRGVIIRPAVKNTLTENLAEGSHYWRIRAVDPAAGKPEYSDVRKVSVIRDQPLRLLSPHNNEVISYSVRPPIINFRWQENKLATDYTVEISRDPGFGGLVRSLTTRLREISVDRLGAGAYYWRVKTKSAGIASYSGASATGGFIVERKKTAGPPALIQPPDGRKLSSSMIGRDRNLIFSWSADNQYQRYEFDLSRDREFRSIVARDETTGNFFRLRDALAPGVYFWRVGGLIDSAPAVYSAAGTLTVVAAENIRLASPTVAAVSKGADNARAAEVRFSWEQSAFKGTYELDISDNNGFLNNMRMKTTSGNSVNMDNVTPGAYYWRVKLFDDRRNLIAESGTRTVFVSTDGTIVSSAREIDRARPGVESAREDQLEIEAEDARNKEQELVRKKEEDLAVKKEAELKVEEEEKARKVREENAVKRREELARKERESRDKAKKEAETKKDQPDNEQTKRDELARKKKEELIKLRQEELALQEKRELARKKLEDLEQKRKEELARKERQGLNRKQQEELAQKKKNESLKRRQEELARKEKEELARRQQEEFALKRKQEQLKRQQEDQARKGKQEPARKEQIEPNLRRQEELALKRKNEQLKRRQEELARKEKQEQALKQREQLAQKNKDEIARRQQEERSRKEIIELARAKEEELARIKEEELARKKGEDLARRQNEARELKKREERVFRKQEQLARKQKEESAKKGSGKIIVSLDELKDEIKINIWKDSVLTVISSVKGGAIYVDSELKGYNACTINVKSGKYIRVEVRADGYREFRDYTLLKKGEKKVLNARLISVLPDYKEKKPGRRIRWKTNQASTGLSRPVYNDNKIFSITRNGFLVGLSMNGAPLWRTNLGNIAHSTPAADGNSVYVVTVNGTLLAVNVQNGAIIWKKSLDGPLLFGAAPIIDDNMIFVATSYGVVQAFDRKGTELWKRKLEEGVFSPMTYENGLLYVGTDRSRIYAIRSRNGEIKWSHETDGRIFSAAPKVYRGTVFVGCYSGTLYALDVADGRLKWKYRAQRAIIASPAFHDDMVYVGSEDGLFCALKIKNGGKMWEFITKGSIVAAPDVYKDAVLVPSGNTVYSVDANSGELNWKEGFAAGINTPVTIVGTNAYVGLESGEMVSLSSF